MFPRRIGTENYGFTQAKRDAIRAKFQSEAEWIDLWNRMVIFQQVGPWLLSHAGLHPDFLWPGHCEMSSILAAGRATMRCLARGETSPLFAIGYERGGDQSIGGPLWLDWTRFDERRDMPPQIVGHTPQTQPNAIGRNWCLDSYPSLQYFARIHEPPMPAGLTPYALTIYEAATGQEIAAASPDTPLSSAKE